VLTAPPKNDGISYDIIAYNRVQGNGFSLEQPTAFRPPAYPLFLAGLYLFASKSYILVHLVQAVLGAVTPLLLFGAVLRSYPGRYTLAFLAAAILAVHPLHVYMTGEIYPEVLSILLLTGCWFVIARAGSQHRNLRWAVGGILLGALSLMRPNAILMIPFMLGVAFVQFPSPATALRAFGLLLLTSGITIGLWTARNYVVFGELIPISTNGGVNLWQGNNPLAHGGRVEVKPGTWPYADPPVDLEGWAGMSERESETRFYSLAFQWIRENPTRFIALMPLKLVRAWAANFGDEAHAVSLPRPVEVGFAIYLLACLAGLALSFRYWRESAFVYVLVSHVCLISMIFYGFTRQSAIAIVAQAALVALAGESVLQHIHRRFPSHSSARAL